MSDSPSQPRAKRQRVDKNGRFAALERLKKLKGAKNKYEVNDVDNVYEEITETEYANRVLSRANDDWIEEDGSGYVEDGRDIFDDDEQDGAEDERKTEKRSKKRESKKRLRDVNKPVDGNGSIRSLFGNVVPKKKDSNVKLEEDDILADILGEIGPGTSNSKEVGAATNGNATTSHSSVTTLSEKSEMAKVKEYMQSFKKNLPEKSIVKDENADDDELLDRILKPSVKLTPKQEAKKSIKQEPESPLSASTENILRAAMKTKANGYDNSLKTDVEPVKDEAITESIPVDEYNDDMDFSILEDDENQFTASDTQQTPVKATEILKKETENYENLLSNWENICNTENDDDDQLLGSIDETSATQQMPNSVDGKTTMKFWFWDAWEEPVKFPGKLFLFGKVQSDKNPNEYNSVCVTIENVERCLYLLPREEILDPTTNTSTGEKVTFAEVYKELSSNLSHDFRCKKVTKNAAFNVPGINVPQTSEYLKVLYDGKHPAPDAKKKYKTIAHIFGINTNALETFLLECKIKGPSWLSISNYTISKVQSTWCKLAINCPSPSSISVLTETKATPPPPLVVATLYVRTALHPKTTTNEIVMIACLVNNRFPVDKRPPNPPFTRHFCAFTRPSSQNWPFGLSDKLAKYKATKVTKLESERALLSWFLTNFKSIDADLIVTHDANDCQLDVICDRLAAIKLPMWSRIGRLNISAMPKKFKDYFVGRMICDVKLSAEELIKSRSYDLQTLCETVLKIKEDERADISNDELHEMYESGDGILKLLTLTMQDCSYIMRLMCELNVLPLALQITNICGNLMGRTLQGGRSERNEFLLLHAFDEKDYIVPDKKVRESNWGTQENTADATQANVTSTGRKKPAYLGGLVLDPIKGFYDEHILLMDFNSLYPSIIQEYNICFTTVDEPDNPDELPELPEPTVEQGVLPRQIRSLVECRREVKKLMVPGLEPELRNHYNIRQTALKLTANSMYGCLGFAHSRFFARHLAALVTQKGRDILLNTKGIVTKLNYDVIYGDTDSIMINTHSVDYDEVFRIGHTIKQAVNKIYRQVELDIDGVFKYMLLLNKKKYACVTITKSKSGELICAQEHKGLDIVRRDWSQLSVVAGKLVLDQLLSDIPLDERIDNIHTHLEKIRDNLNNDEIPLGLLTITKQLTKAPKEYTKISSMPHVQVALRMNSTKNKRFKKGDMINYIICEDGTDNPATQRGYHLDELKTNKELKIDKLYYLSNQVHPVVSRLCKPIEGTDGARIAMCLGLDPNKYKESAQRAHRNQYGGGESLGESLIQSNAIKYRSCAKFKFKCIACKTENEIAKPFFKPDTHYVSVLEACVNKECRVAPIQQLANVRNYLTLAIRQHIRDYYENWMICDEPSCNQSTRTYVHVTDINNRPMCLVCKQGYLLKSYTEGDLYKQLKYYQFMFDLPKFEQSNIRVSPEVEDGFKILKEYVDRILLRSAYQNIKLSDIFKKLQMGVLDFKRANNESNLTQMTQIIQS